MYDTKEIWLDVRKVIDSEYEKLVSLATNNGYDGVLVDFSQIGRLQLIPMQCKKMLFITEQEIEKYESLDTEVASEISVVFTDSEKVLSRMNCTENGMLLTVNDRASLDKAVKMISQVSYIIIEFQSATNIPLELVLANSQNGKCHICKKVKASEEGWIASMVMESGCHSVLLETKTGSEIIELKKKIDDMTHLKLDMKKLSIIELQHIGMGDRVCIDTTSLLNKNEGMILGSTSNGGILVSSETHHLPYMELRPFRVNAGGVHMYAWNLDDMTNYLSEIKAGSKIMVVDNDGNARCIAVGRVKIERRPLILIRAKDENDIEVNVVLQDDWHVRIIGEGGKPLNCTELKPGDIVLGYTCDAGRHVGIRINENIIEK